MSKLILIFSLIFSVLFLLGCTGTEMAICGDGICSEVERDPTSPYYCPQDCEAPLEASVTISAYIPWDVEGDVYLYWYSDRQRVASVSSQIANYIGQNWYAMESQNLHLSFNESKSGSIPFDRQERQITIPISEQGEYYFELRTDDYEYRAVSERVRITRSEDKWINLELVPSNPAIRVRAVDASWNRINGPGKVTLYMVREYDNYGEWVQDELEYATHYFSSGEEINALFFVYNPVNRLRETVYYKAVVSAEGYASSEQRIWIRGKSNVHDVRLYPIVDSIGSLKIEIVPGIGTTWEDVARFEGEEVTVYGNVDNGQNIWETVMVEDGVIPLVNYPSGTYVVSKSINWLEIEDTNKSKLPISLSMGEDNSFRINQGDAGYSKIKAINGLNIKINMRDSQNNLIPHNEIYILEVCGLSSDPNRCFEYETDFELFENPLYFMSTIHSEDQISELEDTTVKLKLRYNNQESWFSFQMKQGFGEETWVFDGNN